MSAWRRVAIEKIPGCRKLIERSDTVMYLWIELGFAAHSAASDEDLIRQIYDYASWCLTSKAPDTVTAVVVAFYEHVPTNPHLRAQMGRWMSTEEFVSLRDVFHYFLSDKEHTEFIREFYEQRERLRHDAKKRQPALRGQEGGSIGQ